MDHDQEIAALGAETLALQSILTNVLLQLGKEDLIIGLAIRRGFDDAANEIENLAIQLGKAARPDHVIKAVRVIEELRTASLGDRDKPKHAV
jgi:hypothetical protein